MYRATSQGRRRPGVLTRIATVGATALLASSAMAMGAPSALAGPTGETGAAAPKAGCGTPVLKAWYDSDQFGTYLKVWFETPKGCAKGTSVSSLSGNVNCTSGPSKGKRVYQEKKSGKAPLSTLTRSLPAKSKCGSFHATAGIGYTLGGGKIWEDAWTWKWGNAPA